MNIELEDFIRLEEGLDNVIYKVPFFDCDAISDITEIQEVRHSSRIINQLENDSVLSKVKESITYVDCIIKHITINHLEGAVCRGYAKLEIVNLERYSKSIIESYLKSNDKDDVYCYFSDYLISLLSDEIQHLDITKCFEQFLQNY